MRRNRTRNPHLETELRTRFGMRKVSRAAILLHLWGRRSRSGRSRRRGGRRPRRSFQQKKPSRSPVHLPNFNVNVGPNPPEPLAVETVGEAGLVAVVGRCESTGHHARSPARRSLGRSRRRTAVCSRRRPRVHAKQVIDAAEADESGSLAGPHSGQIEFGGRFALAGAHDPLAERVARAPEAAFADRHRGLQPQPTGPLGQRPVTVAGVVIPLPLRAERAAHRTRRRSRGAVTGMSMIGLACCSTGSPMPSPSTSLPIIGQPSIHSTGWSICGRPWKGAADVLDQLVRVPPRSVRCLHQRPWLQLRITPLPRSYTTFKSYGP